MEDLRKDGENLAKCHELCCLSTFTDLRISESLKIKMKFMFEGEEEIGSA